jgi:hypothetical protein
MQTICEARQRLQIRVVVLNTLEKQDIQAVHMVRARLMGQQDSH